MLCAVGPRMTGESEFLHIFLTIIGPVLIASAAVIAALVARRTANERQLKQLLHDTQRQEVALAHDREMRDREHVRSTISDAIEALTEATYLVIAMGSAVTTLERARERLSAAEEDALAGKAFMDLQDALNSAYQEYVALSDQTHESTLSLFANTSRIRLVVGPESELVETHKTLANAVRSWYENVTQGGIKNRDEDELKKAANGLQDTRRARYRFEDACRQWFGWTELRPAGK